MTESTGYQSPLGTRYASPPMQNLWSAQHRAQIWRRLWLALAEQERALGLDIPEAAIEEMRAHLDDADLETVRRYERRFRHDVMAHVHHFGDQAPAARPFLHLGATSCYVTDNAELIVMRDGLSMLVGRLAAVARSLATFAERTRSIPTVAYTHYQPAQLTTVGKRATLWLHDFLLDIVALRELVEGLPFRGCKGTAGTQATYLELFKGDHEKVRALDRAVAAAFGFDHSVPVSGQTYSRKIDSRVMDALGGIGQSAAKFGTDLRLLQHEGEVLEPFEQEQIGSSAMPHKRNPMRAERICALSRYILAQQETAHYTAATQWLERTLDDSAIRRLALPDGFMAADAALALCTNVAAGLELREATIQRNVERAMPFMAVERWLMLGVEAGGDRQGLHEVMREHSLAASAAVSEGRPNDLLERLAADAAFGAISADRLRAELDPGLYIGRAPQQVTEFLEGPAAQLLDSLTAYEAPDEAKVSV
jgi:adenylosuccinate lyase